MSDDLSDYEARLQAARILYEGTRGMSLADLSVQTDIPLRLLKQRSRDEGWRKRLEIANGGQTADAAAMSEAFKTAPPPEPTTDQAVVVETANHVGAPMPSVIDEVLERHRREWAAPRGLSAEAMRLRDSEPGKAFERAKMAKITAETLKLVQDGERKAYGIDAGHDLPPGSVVVIERGNEK